MGCGDLATQRMITCFHPRRGCYHTSALIRRGRGGVGPGSSCIRHRSNLASTTFHWSNGDCWNPGAKECLRFEPWRLESGSLVSDIVAGTPWKNRIQAIGRPPVACDVVAEKESL